METKMFSIDVPFAKDGGKVIGVNAYSGNKPYLAELSANNMIEWTEKVDGQAIVIAYEGEAGDGRIHVYGKTQNASLDAYIQKVADTFKTSAMEEYFEEKFSRKPYILYAEGISPKNLGKVYGYKDEAKFFLFDVQNAVNGAFWGWQSVKEVAEATGLNFIGEPFTASIADVANLLMEQPIRSQFGADGAKVAIEGFVGRAKYGFRDNNGQRIITKVKVETLTGHKPEHNKAVIPYEEAVARFRG